MPAHKLAEVMHQYALDARVSETPWVFWEYTFEDVGKWYSCYAHPNWNLSSYVYRKKGNEDAK